MKLKDLYIGIQGFLLGLMVMAYITGYNTSLLPILLWGLSILLRPDFD